jgi:hypothetical protein
VDLHHLLLAGLPAHFESDHLSQAVVPYQLTFELLQSSALELAVAQTSGRTSAAMKRSRVSRVKAVRISWTSAASMMRETDPCASTGDQVFPMRGCLMAYPCRLFREEPLARPWRCPSGALLKTIIHAALDESSRDPAFLGLGRGSRVGDRDFRRYPDGANRARDSVKPGEVAND